MAVAGGLPGLLDLRGLEVGSAREHAGVGGGPQGPSVSQALSQAIPYEGHHLLCPIHGRSAWGDLERLLDCGCMPVMVVEPVETGLEVRPFAVDNMGLGQKWTRW
jgi:hypothetical protein